MLPRERIRCVFEGRLPDRVPFVPTIYEHAAFLVNQTPSSLAQDAKLIIESQVAAFERYAHDLVTVGVDIYNVEAEALGCEVQYFDSCDIPGIRTTLVRCLADLKELTIPNPHRDGRMPLMLEAAIGVKSRLGDIVPVGGTIVGPFTLACIIRGVQEFLLDVYSDREFFTEILEFSCRVGEAYGSAMIKSGLGLAINESFCSAPFLSPTLYSEVVFPIHRRLVQAFRKKGALNIGLIIGGNTSGLIEKLVQTGTSILIADFNSDLSKYKHAARQGDVVVRGNVDPKLLANGTAEELLDIARHVLKVGMPGGRFLLGTGVVPYDSIPERLDLLRELVEQEGKYTPCLKP